jgi:hypothetical protein
LIRQWTWLGIMHKRKPRDKKKVDEKLYVNILKTKLN